GRALDAGGSPGFPLLDAVGLQLRLLAGRGGFGGAERAERGGGEPGDGRDPGEVAHGGLRGTGGGVGGGRRRGGRYGEYTAGRGGVGRGRGKRGQVRGGRVGGGR